MKKKLIVMVGASGSGKSTYIKNNLPTATICSADHYFMKDGKYNFDARQLGRAHDQCFFSFTKALDDKKELIVIDNTSTRKRDILTYVEPALLNDYEIEIIVLKVPVLVAFKRNAHAVPLDTIDKMVSSIENTLKLLRERTDIKITIIGE